ncbi:MAG: type II toxin-antitoxin system VapC family toxin [Ilumatobacteraceae bacterium]
MIVDTSAVLAILRNEPDARRYATVLAASERTRMSAGNWLEAANVVDSRRDPIGSRRFDELIAQAGIEIVPVTPAQAAIARQAYRDFGRGSGHAAQLNFGDCFAYALASEAGEPILFKGNDFVHTDLQPA